MIITVLSLLLIFLCIVVVMLIMIQRTSGGMGSALGGGAADQVLGAGSAAQLTKLTVWGILGFFILSFSLYALYQKEAGERSNPTRAQSQEIRTDPDSSPASDPAVPAPGSSDPLMLPPSPGQGVAPLVPAPPAQGVVEQPVPIQEIIQPNAPLQPAPAPEANSSQ
jgi:protein translocase SecG subunit